MPATSPARTRVLVDADVLFAGSVSPSEHGASQLVLRMAEITLIEAVAPQQVISEAKRNLIRKLPQALPALRLIVSRCLPIVPNPLVTDLDPYRELVHPEDLPILVAAQREHCPWLVTFNVRDYQPGHPDVKVLRPGEFVLRVREQLAHLWVMDEL